MTENGDKKRPTRKLTVENFSVIKHAELEFGKITVLIGPQASGKSLLCKLAYFFEQSVSELVLDGLRSQASLSKTKEHIVESFLLCFPEDDIKQKRFRVKYQIDPSFSISIEMNDTFSSPHLEWKNGDINAFFKSWQSNDPKRPPSHNSDRRREFMSGADIGPLPIESDSVYIPTGRAFFSTPNKGFAALSTKNLDWITNRFATEFDANYRDLRESYQTSRSLLNEVGLFSVEMTKGRVVQEDGRLLFESIEDGRKRPHEILSSGTLELLPIFNTLAQVARKTGDPTNSKMPAPPVGMVYIEEPESSVFPKTQYQFAKLTALLANSDLLWKSYVITTHSPYILSAFGNLIKAGDVGRTNPDGTKSVVDPKYWIDRDDFRAYALKPSDSEPGRFETESIFNRETGELNADYLDNVSSDIADEFGKLLELQYGG